VPRTRSPGWDDQHRQILDVAARLFATRGYTATTMNEVAAGCGVRKPTLYHYVRDKQDLLAQIALSQMARLEAVVAEVDAAAPAPAERLRTLVVRFMDAYSTAEQRHRVLTEDVKFLAQAERDAVVAAERRVLASFADAILEVRPDLAPERLGKPLAMLLFGMINWTFTWLKAGGALTHESLTPVVVDLLFGGLPAVRPPKRRAG
jgi:TetR/AcrR family transcriptional regulator